MSGRANGMNTGIQCTQRKDGYWMARFEAGYTPQGKRYRPAVVRKTERQAKAAARALKREYEAKGQQFLTGRQWTVKAWVDRWLELKRLEYRPHVWRNSRGLLNNWVVTQIGNVRLHELTPDHMRRVAGNIVDAAKSPTTAANVHRLAMTCLRDARRDGLTVQDAVIHMRPPRKDINPRGAIPMSDVQRLIPVIAQRPDAARWLTGLYLGLRQGEVLGLT